MTRSASTIVAVVLDYRETVAKASRLAATQGIPNREPNVDCLLAEMGTTSERSFRAFLSAVDVESLMQQVAPTRTGVRSWNSETGHWELRLDEVTVERRKLGYL